MHGTAYESSVPFAAFIAITPTFNAVIMNSIRMDRLSAFGRRQQELRIDLASTTMVGGRDAGFGRVCNGGRFKGFLDFRNARRNVLRHDSLQLPLECNRS